MRAGLANPRAWSRSGLGIGHGWFGWAWAWLHLVRAGLAPDRARTRATIARRLATATYLPGRVGSIVGSGAGPTLAALLAAIDPADDRVLETHLRRWELQCRTLRRFDVFDGAAGALLAAAEIEALRPGAISPAHVRRCREHVSAHLEAELGPRDGRFVTLGFAHGIAGLLVALEAAAQLGHALSPALRERAIDYLMRERVRGPGELAAWPIAAADQPRFANGWCNGTAGVALAALAAQRLSGAPSYAPLVASALAGTFALRGGHASFCCGTIGQAQILIEAARLTGDRRWLARARRTADAIGAPSTHVRSLAQGTLGRIYLELRLAHPALPLPGLGRLSVAN
jgi:lanthionine synthetase-like protein